MVKRLAEQIHDSMPSVIWYYGAGVVELQAADIVRQIFNRHLPHPQLHISNDLEGAARAACGKEPGTIVILGTGSHAAVFDGFHILRQANALGYMLGDEGSGCDIGKELVKAYFYNQMPEVVRVEMKKLIPAGRGEFLKGLYASGTPNQLLADMAKVAVGLYDHPWIKELISERFSLFVRKLLLPLAPSSPVHIVGSIGCIFADQIDRELQHNGLKAGHFIQDPSFRLFEMHLEHDFNEK